MAIKDLLPLKKHLFICNGGTCKLNGAEQGTTAIRHAITEAGLDATVHTTKTMCNGRCNDGPVIISMPDGIWFKRVLPEHAKEFVNTFLIKSEIPEDHLLYRYGGTFINPTENVIITEIKAE
jgi:(2Fe-2S) ferredoxin